MAAFAVPSYRRAIEQSRIDIAGANLRAIWAAERLYWLQNQTYTTDIATLRKLGLLDRKLPTGNGSEDNYWNSYFYYTIEASTKGHRRRIYGQGDCFDFYRQHKYSSNRRNRRAYR